MYVKTMIAGVDQIVCRRRRHTGILVISHLAGLRVDRCSVRTRPSRAEAADPLPRLRLTASPRRGRMPPNSTAFDSLGGHRDVSNPSLFPVAPTWPQLATKHLELCLPKGVPLRQLLLPEVSIELGHQKTRRLVVHRPQCRDHRARSGDLERSLEPEQPLATRRLPQPGLAGRKDGQVALRKIQRRRLRARSGCRRPVPAGRADGLRPRRRCRRAAQGGIRRP